MKILLILIAFSNCLFGQIGFIENPSNNILYQGIQNDLLINFPGIACDSIIFYSKNATIISTSCKLEVTPNKCNTLELLIFRKNVDDSILIGNRIYRVIPIPKTEVSIGGLNGGAIRKNYLLAQVGLLISNPLNIDIYYNKFSYEILLIRNKKIKRKLSSNNFRFTEKELSLLQYSKIADIILIYNINITDQNNNKLEVSPIQFNIIE